MYKIVLQRKSEHSNIKKPNSSKFENSTLGQLSVLDGQGNCIYSCFTCENGGESTDTPNQDKRIVAREYKIEWSDSSKNNSLAKAYPAFKLPSGRNKVLWVTCDDVLPSFRNRRILIHVGNYPQDTEGCILLGKTLGEGIVQGSTLACFEFFKLVEKIGAENCVLIVKEI